VILERALLHAVCLAIDAGIEGRGDRSAAPRNQDPHGQDENDRLPYDVFVLLKRKSRRGESAAMTRKGMRPG